jgi:plastocyanin
MSLRSFCIGAAVIVAAAGCGGGGGGYGSGPAETGTPGGTTGSTSSTITVSNNRFDPATTTVQTGTTVTWTWAQGATNHNVTFADGTKSATQATGTYSRSFGVAGTYAYECTVHSGMSGTVTVR